VWLFFLILLAFLFLYKPFLLGHLFFLRDFGAYFYPLRHLTLSFIKGGIFPFWNPYIDLGVPLFADIQSQILYPPSLLLLLGLNFGLCLFILFHFILGGLSCFYLARHLGLDKPSSFVSALVFIFSGWFVSSINILTCLAGSSWIPLIFYLFFKKRVFLSGIAICLQFLGGELSILYGTIISLFFYSIYKKEIKGFGLVCLIGFSLSLFQALPFLEFISFSTRSNIDIKTATYWSFAPWEVLRFFIPSIMGSPIETYKIAEAFKTQLWLNSPYIGIIPILFVLLSFKEKRGMFFFILSLFFLLLSFGKYTPFYDIFSTLPFFRLLRYPVKFLSIFTLSASLIAGYGFSLIYEKKGLFLFAIFSFLFGGISLFLYFGKNLFVEKYWIESLFKDTLFIFIILSLSLFFILLLKKDKIKKPLFAFLFIGLIITDLFYFSSRIAPTTSSKIYQFKPGVLEAIKEKKDRVLITPITKRDFMEPTGASFEEVFLKRLVYLMPNIGLLHKIFYTSSYSSIKLLEHAQFMWVLENNPFPFVSHLVSLVNARYIISSHPLQEKNLKFIFRDGKNGPFLYENLDCLERAFIVYNYKIIKDRIKILEYMLDRLSVRDEIVLEEEPEHRTQSTEHRAQSTEYRVQMNKVEIIKYEPNRVVIDVETERPGFLFLSDTYYPGWKAYIRTQNTEHRTQKEVKVYRANYCFRAVYVPKGKYLVEFKYFPKAFIIGLIASIISIILITGMYLYQNKK